MDTVLNRLLAVFIISQVVACASMDHDEQPGDPLYAPVISMNQPAARSNIGSIYRQHQGVSLFTDRRANRIGDIVTIVLTEQTQSSKSAGTEISKSGGLNISTPSLLGTVPSLHNLELDADLAHDRDFSGEGKSNQSNSLSGSIAVTIADIMPNGLLVVQGEKWLTLNQGDEFVRVRGMIRPEDIGPDNTIMSTKVADARITYSGSGELNASNQAGWGSRFFNSKYWPF